MRLRSLKNGVQISSDIRIDSPLESHRGIATYLASHKQYGHALVHILPDFDDSAEKPLDVLAKAAEFYRNNLGIQAECGVYEEFIYFCETFPLGEYMFEWLERHERVTATEAIKRVIQLLKTLTAAHEQGLFHGRITPKSLLLERTGDAFGLRLMGLGVSQVMPPSMQFDLDWFDYSFDLEGMDAIAVDIYGVAIVLMGLVCGESGIDSFEASGLLPPPFRSGLLQQAMERALALRSDAYASLLAFSIDLEAALLEIDNKEGEMYIGDLVGYESAVRSVTSISNMADVGGQPSGEWSSLVDHLEGEERSSLLFSLTSLTALPAIHDDDEDEDVTHVSALPDSVLGMRRIHSKHAEADTDNDQRARKLRAEAGNHDAEEASTNRSASFDKLSQDAGRNAATDAFGVALSDEKSQKLSEIQAAETELDDFDEDDEDEGPTRIMARPNYLTVSVTPKKESEAKKVASELIESLAEEKEDNGIAAMTARILKAVVTEADIEVGSDTQYEVPDEPEPPAPAAPPLLPGNDAHHEKTQALAKKRKQKRVIMGIIITALLIVIIFLLIVSALKS